MARVKVDNVEPDERTVPKSHQVHQQVEHRVKEEVAVVSEDERERDPRFPTEPTTDEELKQKSGSPMAAFAAFPRGVHFSGEHNDEEIVLLLRAHLVTNVPWILIAIVLVLVPIVVVPFLAAVGFFPTLPPGMIFVLILFWYLVTFTFSFVNVLYWYFNVGIVTNERVVDIDWHSVIYRDVATAQMSKVQDVRADQIGVIAGFFDFGSVFVQTAGTEPNVEFLNVPHPQLVVRKIQELMAAEEKEWEHNP